MVCFITFAQINGSLDLPLYTVFWEEALILFATPAVAVYYKKKSQIKDTRVKGVAFFYILSRSC